MSTRASKLYTANLGSIDAGVQSVFVRLIAVAIIMACPFRLPAATLDSGEPVGSAAPVDGAPVVGAVPLPPTSLPKPPDVPPTVTRKRFDVKLTSAELAVLRLPSRAFPTEPPPLGLSRLTSEIRKSDFDVDLLELQGSEAGARRRRQNGIPYVDVEEGRQWKRPLRQSSQQVLFVSILMNAGLSTSVDVGGAVLRVATSEDSDCGEIETAERTDSGESQWKRLHYRVPVDLYDGRRLAQLPLLTLRIDRKGQTWDLFSGYLRVAAGLPLAGGKKSNSKHILVEPGREGAWICGIVSSDDNPLFLDSNKDGVDDGLEWMDEAAVGQEKGAQVKEPRPAPVQWTPTLHLVRPLPDRMVKVNTASSSKASEEHQ